jgi:hypothetical protein
MRFEFHDNSHAVGSAQWEGPGQVTFDVADRTARERLERYFATEADYFGTAFDEDEEAFQSRRRDWTPWEFERACRALGHAMGYRVEQTPSQAVEAREAAS